MYTNSFGSMAGGGDPWRDNFMGDGTSAEMDGNFVDPCEMGEWTGWSACSVACGGGTQTRTREIIWESPKLACPPTTETQSCNPHCCYNPGVCVGGDECLPGTEQITAPGTPCGATTCTMPCPYRTCAFVLRDGGYQTGNSKELNVAGGGYASETFPNLDTIGWGAIAQSFKMYLNEQNAGTKCEATVCTGINYTGECRRFSGAAEFQWDDLGYAGNNDGHFNRGIKSVILKVMRNDGTSEFNA
jgi:hypothetical protein